jgi:hypothetical protein
MNRREFLISNAAAAAALPAQSCDVFVYGSTPGGIAAAVQAARGGAKVLLACPKTHPGGMAASGLSTTDAVRPELFGGLVVEFISLVRSEYQRVFAHDAAQLKMTRDGWYYEPSVAEHAFVRLLEAEQKQLRWLPGTHLTSATVSGGRVRSVEIEDARGARSTVTARTYIDGTYEGDLAGAAKVPYRVGREGRDEYGEPSAGIHYMNWRTGAKIPTPDTGEPSLAIQAFCARSIFTDDPGERVVITKPATYEQHLQDFIPLLDDFASGRVKTWGWGTPLPRRKYQMNGDIEALTSLNCPGVNWTWPQAGRRHRERLHQFHIDHAAGLIWFLQNEPKVPEAIRTRMRQIGLDRREFRDSGHWPWQIYVRQGRRILGREILTERSFLVDPRTGRTPKVKQPVAIGEHSFDVHPCHDRRFAVEGFMEGVLWYPKKAAGPAQPGQVPYGALLPKGVDNLLVPVALSTTHMAMSVMRMEPAWMTTGQIAGLAATIAAEQRVEVAAIDPVPLPGKLKISVDPWALGKMPAGGRLDP